MIQREETGGTGILRMSHGKANALDVDLCRALAEHLREDRAASTRALVLTGTGRIFSAGVDLLRVLDGGPGYLRAFLPALQDLLLTLFTHPKPVVAALNGHAIAGGCIVACAADHRIMVRGAGRLGVPELQVGVAFPTIAIEILRLVAAPAALRELVCGGKTVEPDRARELGLVDELAEPESLLDRALEAASTLGALPPPAFALTKRQLRQPALDRAQGDDPGFDSAVEALWGRPETIAAIRSYVARTLKGPAAPPAIPGGRPE